MARTIKFALEMKDGVKVRRTLEEIREHFDLGKAMEHFASGKLAEWLEDRGYEEEAAGLRALDSHGPDFPRQLCDVLGVEYTGGEEVDMDAAVRLNEKRSRLRQMTEDEEIIDRAAEVAFTQEDLAERLKAGAEVIYLCGEAFTVPLEAAGRKYVGIGKKPRVSIAAESPKELEEKKILFENVELPENLRLPTIAELKQIQADSHPSPPGIAELKQILADSHPTHQDLGEVWLEIEIDEDCIYDYRSHMRNLGKSEAEIQKSFEEHRERTIVDLNMAVDNSLVYTHEKYSEEDIIRHVVDADPFSFFGGWWCLTKDSLMINEFARDVHGNYDASHGDTIILYKDIINVKKGNFSEGHLSIDCRTDDGEIYSVTLNSSYFTWEAEKQLETYLNRVKDLFADE